jgi:acetyl/propionyl-CoA carboxylase alpha subunit
MSSVQSELASLSAHASGLSKAQRRRRRKRKQETGFYTEEEKLRAEAKSETDAKRALFLRRSRSRYAYQPIKTETGKVPRKKTQAELGPIGGFATIVFASEFCGSRTIQENTILAREAMKMERDLKAAGLTAF